MKGGRSQKIFFRPFGPQFGLKIMEAPLLPWFRHFKWWWVSDSPHQTSTRLTKLADHRNLEKSVWSVKARSFNGWDNPFIFLSANIMAISFITVAYLKTIIQESQKLVCLFLDTVQWRIQTFRWRGGPSSRPWHKGGGVHSLKNFFCCPLSF